MSIFFLLSLIFAIAWIVFAAGAIVSVLAQAAQDGTVVPAVLAVVCWILSAGSFATAVIMLIIGIVNAVTAG